MRKLWIWAVAILLWNVPFFGTILMLSFLYFIHQMGKKEREEKKEEVEK